MPPSEEGTGGCALINKGGKRKEDLGNKALHKKTGGKGNSQEANQTAGLKSCQYIRPQLGVKSPEGNHETGKSPDMFENPEENSQLWQRVFGELLYHAAHLKIMFA